MSTAAREAVDKITPVVAQHFGVQSSALHYSNHPVVMRFPGTERLCVVETVRVTTSVEPPKWWDVWIDAVTHEVVEYIPDA